MFSKLLNTVKTTVVTPTHIKIAILLITLILFILGAGAPSDTGGLGGF